MTWWLCGLLVVASAVVLGGIIAAEHRTVARTERRDLAGTRPSPRRIAGESALLVAAVGGVVLLRRRGLGATVVGGLVDPYIVAVPVLVALAAALVVLRVYPLPMRALARAASGRRGLVGFLGLARAGRQTASAAAPVVVLLVGLSFAIFSSVLLHTVRVEQQAVAWDTVGADLRVDGTDFDPDTSVASIAAAAGVTAADVFGVHVQPTATLRGPIGAEDFDLLLLDPAAYQAFVAAHPVNTSGLDPLVAAPSGAGQRIPALISPRLQSALRLGATGDVPFYLPGHETVLNVLGVEPSFPGYDSTELWAVARTSDAEQVIDLPYWPSILYLDAPSADPATVLTAAHDLQRFAVLTSETDVYDAIAQAPLIRATGTAFALATGVAAGYCLLAILLALVVGARSRGQFLSYLRTLGLSSGQARSLAAWEIAPPAIVATLVGAGLGLLLPRIVLPAIDLRPFTGGVDAPALLVNGAVVVTLSVGLLVVVTAAVFVITSVNRRRQLGAALRVGEES